MNLRWLGVPGEELVYPFRKEGHFLGDFFGVLNFKFRTHASPASAATP